MRGQRGEPGIGKRVIVAEKRRRSPRRRCRRGSKEEEVGGARLEIRSMAKKAREKAAQYKAYKGREEVRSKRARS
jgi:hypothetical protein